MERCKPVSGFGPKPRLDTETSQEWPRTHTSSQKDCSLHAFAQIMQGLGLAFFGDGTLRQPNQGLLWQGALGGFEVHNLPGQSCQTHARPGHFGAQGLGFRVLSHTHDTVVLSSGLAETGDNAVACQFQVFKAPYRV